MHPIPTETWSEMSELHNGITTQIDASHLSPTEILVVLNMIQSKILQLLELQKRVV